MGLSPEQLKVIQECARDDASYQRLLALYTDIQENTSQPEALETPGLLFDFDPKTLNLLRTVINTIPVSVYVKDRQSRFVLANDITLRESEVDDLEEIYGKTDFDLTTEENAEKYYEIEQRLMETGESIIDQEIYVPEIGDSPQWLLTTKGPIRDQHGNVIGLIGINRNITEQKKAEIRLAEERNLLKTVIDNIRDKIYIKDRQGRFIMANTSTLSAQVITAEDLIGMSDFDFMEAERAQVFHEQEQHIMETGEAIVNEELFVPDYLTRDVDRWYLVTKAPVYDESGNIIGLVGINREITRHKLAAKQKTELQLERERSRILANFIRGVSHEFRTPISIIQTAMYIFENSEDPQKQAVYTSQIMEQVNRLKALVESMIDLTRLDQHDQILLKPVHLNQCIDVLLSQTQPQVDAKKLHINQTSDDAHVMVNADEVLLSVALGNILNNAIQFTPENGNITINVTTTPDKAITEIHDTGIGMTEEVLPNIFTRFYREDIMHATEGFGLGLPISQRIVELHNGEIKVESTPGDGSVFKVILPKYMEN